MRVLSPDDILLTRVRLVTLAEKQKAEKYLSKMRANGVCGIDREIPDGKTVVPFKGDSAYACACNNYDFKTGQAVFYDVAFYDVNDHCFEVPNPPIKLSEEPSRQEIAALLRIGGFLRYDELERFLTDLKADEAAAKAAAKAAKKAEEPPE